MPRRRGPQPRRACTRGPVAQSNETLEDLDLSPNSIDNDGVAAIAGALAANGSLRRLNLAANRVGDVGAAALAEMLRSNGALEELDLSSNEIEYDGAHVAGRAA